MLYLRRIESKQDSMGNVVRYTARSILRIAIVNGVTFYLGSRLVTQYKYLKDTKKFNFYLSLNISVLVLRRFYSSNRDNNCDIKPVVFYNCNQDKGRILKENQKKAAVYRLVNNINNKTYIGSSVNCTNRFYKYFNLKYLTERRTPIHLALLKYGYKNFTLEILEYCEEGVNPITREQYYFSKLKPEYNILEQAGSSLGYKHTEATLDFFKNERKVSDDTKKNLSIAATGRVLTEEDKQKISNARKGIILSTETRSKISSAAIALRGVTVIVKNVNTNEELEFVSLTDAAKYIGVSRPAIRKYVDTNKLIQGIYLVITK